MLPPRVSAQRWRCGTYVRTRAQGAYSEILAAKPIGPLNDFTFFHNLTMGVWYMRPSLGMYCCRSAESSPDTSKTSTCISGCLEVPNIRLSPSPMSNADYG